MATPPLIRTDLTATPVETDGVKYVDVEQPVTGLLMRMFDFEWQVAQRMDGSCSYDDLASWARVQLRRALTVDDLLMLTARMETAGFFQPEAAPPVVVEASRPNPALLKALAQTLQTKPKTEQQSVDSMKDFFKKPMAHTEPEARRRRGPAISSSLLSGMGIIAVLMVVPVLVYVSFMKPDPIWKVHTQVATAKDLVDLFDGADAVKRPEAQALAFAESGTVAQIVARGTEATPKMVLATLEEKARAEEEIDKLTRRLDFYVKKHDVKKVAEKKKFIADRQARLPRLQLFAPTAGTVAEVLAQAGTAVKAGQPVLTLGEPRMTAAFSVPDPTDFPKGTAVKLQAVASGALLPGHAGKSSGPTVIVELDDGSGAQVGDQVRLVQRHIPLVVRLPASAVARRGGMSTVFVLEHGLARAHTVTVLERTPTEVRISSGLHGVETVITDPPEIMQDGEKAELAER